MEKLYAAVRLRGHVGMSEEMEMTLRMLNLHRVNSCVVLPETESTLGMLKKISNFITYGEIDGKTLAFLFKKRLKAADKEGIIKKLGSPGKFEDLGIKPVFRLSPPSKGLKSIKALYPKGDLGYRGEKINELLGRMI
ncbi:MAG: uL30 family ribosomal protein [Candidatus Aenigmarchaeota archaeon]|nr:uL30 family ribosomal protein [Candidatus Aenigmarchaeota archaeon]